ncbi:putative sulfate exporter family transporter [Niallia nealsonii]|uniref:Uncharacterized protein n=1 Tax=Niallia nealsonii TaxID=115979 RepID=A0A2N0Z399_9BACI|nr:hypothetical protein CWS01_09475 [Niallia nealsonii]
MAATTVALLGTIFTFADTLLFSFLNLSKTAYGIFTGGTLHEVGHVIAAAAVSGSDAVEIAIIVKLTPVALLVPSPLFYEFSE